MTTSATPEVSPSARAAVPAWPLGALLAGYPVWWALGVVDFAWIIFAALQVLFLVQGGAVRAPRWFGLWLAFLVWMTLSVTQLDTFSRLIGFGYRHLIYLSATVVFLYIYNGRQRLHDRFMLGLITVYWLITVAGGFLGMLLPTTVVRTPLARVLPGFLLNNELVNHMVVRRFAQYDPNSFFGVDPRPSAPFLYTNNWGNAYSLMLPFVILYLLHVRGRRRFWLLLPVLPLSFIPAAATLNRGMFLGLAIAAVYLGVRYLLRGRPIVLISLTLASLLGLSAFAVSSFDEEISSRVQETSTTEDRAEIYIQTLRSVQENPILGLGAPRPSTNPNIPPVGTHGQFWIVIHSHGLPAVTFFVGWFAFVFFSSLRRRDDVGTVANAVLLVALAEFFYYGFLPVGLMLTMISSALALRGVSPAPPQVERRLSRVTDVTETTAGRRY
ncbi:O-antigen ligase family protein [Serinicoccus sediminis]|uniref:O-antigen ligase family protein n=1 Tax=Serinicoccus sediminis TaxID=2306021 RepID=UPI00102030D9|nr:O-antigen ligase family protein [Serinicoccus sediminis]